jgi:hypothetical protein
MKIHYSLNNILGPIQLHTFKKTSPTSHSWAPPIFPEDIPEEQSPLEAGAKAKSLGSIVNTVLPNVRAT